MDLEVDGVVVGWWVSWACGGLWWAVGWGWWWVVCGLEGSRGSAMVVGVGGLWGLWCRAMVVGWWVVCGYVGCGWWAVVAVGVGGRALGY